MSPRQVIGGIEVGHGEKRTGYLELGRRADGSPWGIPLLLVNGANAGKTICIDACMHGDEGEGTLALLDVFEAIDPEDFTGTFIGVPALNLPAFEVGSRGSSPHSEVYIFDMNRIMPGKVNGSTTLRLAGNYMNELALKSDYVISLHGGGLAQYRVERIIYPVSIEGGLELAQAFGPEWDVLQAGVPAEGSIEKVCAAHGIPCVISELGGSAGRMPEFQDLNVQKIVSGISNVLKTYGFVAGEPTPSSTWTYVGNTHGMFSASGGVISPSTDFRMKAVLRRGTTLLTIRSLFGEVLEEIRAPYDGMVLGFKSTVTARPGDVVCSFGEILPDPFKHQA